jgi:MFS family permease
MPEGLREQLRESGRAFAAVFRNPNLRWVEVSWAGTVCAYWIFIVALGFYAYQRGGATAVGLVGLLRVLPSVVAAPFGTVLGDRYPRNRVIVGINVARSITIVGAAAAVYLSAPAGIVYALASLMGLLQSVFRPTQTALLPVLARTPQELTAANLALTTVESVGVFAGPAIGGGLLAVTGTDTIFAITGGAFLLAALLLTRVSSPAGLQPAAPQKSFLREALVGFSTVGRDARLRLIIGLYGVQTLVAGAMGVLIVVMALRTLDLGKSGIGFLNSAWGVGGFLGGVAALGLVARPRLGSAFGIGLVLAGLPLAGIALLPYAGTAVAFLGLVGVGITIVDVAGVTLLQRTIPDQVLTRVMGVVQSVFVGTLGLGAIAVPGLIALVGDRWTLAVVGLISPTAASLAWTQLRRLDGESAQAPANVAVLRAIDIFRPLPQAVVEQLAQEAETFTTPAGEEVVREGEHGDRFYVILAGEADVLVDGVEREHLGAGGYFGEIALLRDVPRTATVVARTALTMLGIDRDEFLGAVTGHPESADAADAVVATRLGSIRPGVATI